MVHSLGEAAVLQESLLQALELAVQQVGRLIDEADQGVGGGLGRGGVDGVGVGPVGQVRLVGRFDALYSVKLAAKRASVRGSGQGIGTVEGDFARYVRDRIRTCNLRLRRPTRYPIVPRGLKRPKSIVTGRPPSTDLLNLRDALPYEPPIAPDGKTAIGTR